MPVGGDLELQASSWNVHCHFSCLLREHCDVYKEWLWGVDYVKRVRLYYIKRNLNPKTRRLDRRIELEWY